MVARGIVMAWFGSSPVLKSGGQHAEMLCALLGSGLWNATAFDGNGI